MTVSTVSLPSVTQVDDEPSTATGMSVMDTIPMVTTILAERRSFILETPFTSLEADLPDTYPVDPALVPYKELVSNMAKVLVNN